ncbi:hypothetical protein FDP41_002323 [Naegleria fowleri]|uniref:RWP-RK domain-containing protein n=1 Tax=Naegleria fowleri TaxID=5763 RepID=A0A6A5BKI2_NAEFO|nr:uncharacterized protein FDP41_002323 [Naegleria fowleri]KAF0978503.1 hypothetical protein FDP41_002323 [Naegleria fowleri]
MRTRKDNHQQPSGQNPTTPNSPLPALINRKLLTEMQDDKKLCTQHRRLPHHYHQHIDTSSTSHSSSCSTSGSDGTISKSRNTSSPDIPVHVFKAFEAKPTKDWKLRSRKRSSQCISLKEILSVLHLTQHQACKLLGCSVSTVKRRFSDLKDQIGLTQWPKDYFDLEGSVLFKKIYPLSLNFILNEEEDDSLQESNANEQQRKKKKMN